MSDTDFDLDALIKEIEEEQNDEAKQAAPDPAPEPAPQVQDELVQDIMQEIKALRAKLDEPKQQASDEPPVKLETPTITNEELGNIAAYRDKLEKLARSAVGEDLKQITAVLADLKKLADDLRAQQAQQQEASFAAMLRVAVPDIDSLPNDPEFNAYLAERAPMSGGRTIGQLLQDAYERKDLNMVREIVSQFKARKQAKQGDALPSADARPPISQAPTAKPSGSSRADKIAEARQELLKAFMNKKIPYERYIQLKEKLDQMEAGSEAGIPGW